MLALGSVKSALTDSVKNGRAHFDMHGFLTGVVLADLNLAGRPRPCPAGGRAGLLCAGLCNVSDPHGSPCVRFNTPAVKTERAKCGA